MSIYYAIAEREDSTAVNYLSPSILAADFSNLRRDIAKSVESGAQYVHIDVMDGVFVPNISIGFPVIESLRPHFECVFDVHLMIDKPERYVERFAGAGADIITFHAESTENIKETIDLIHRCSKKAGLSVRPGTDIGDIKEYLADVDMVLVMTVEPGFGGQSFMPDMLEKARELKAYRDENNLMFDIEADGGINLKNVRSVLDSGVNVIVAGSSVFSGDKISENTRAFIEILAD